MPVVVLGAVLAHVLNADVQQRSLETARTTGTLITQVGVQPLLNAQQLTDGLTPLEVAQVDDKLQGASVNQDVRRIKVWNRNGTIIYSDNHALIGRTLSIDSDLSNALGGHSTASITDGHDEENSGDNLAGPLIQVYVPLVFKDSSSPSGAFELYLPYAPVQAAIDSESRQLYLFLFAGLALFYASMFPVVLLADRWRRRLLREAQETALANLAVLERLNGLKSDFLTRISHQFRTALVGIQGFSELIKDSEQLDQDEVRAFASDIYRDAAELDHAVNEMIELDNIEAGRATLKISRADVNQLIGGAVETVRRQSPEHTIIARLDAAVPAVSCDVDKIAQVLGILLGNAAKYSPAGTEIQVTSRQNAAFVEIAVRDHGPGMPADFDITRIDSRLGAGLGLSIAREIVEMHVGRLWVESTGGHGAEFHFTLPIRVRQTREMKAVARPA